MKKFKKLMLVGMMALVLIGVQATSHALTLGFSDGMGGSLFLQDNSDFLSYSGPVGSNSNWFITVLSGSSSGTASGPVIGLSLDASSVGGGLLAFGVVDSGFAGPMDGTSFVLNAGGTTGGTVLSFAFGDTTNSGTFIGTPFDFLSFGAGAFSGTASGSFGSFSFESTTPFSLGIMGFIIHESSAMTMTTFDASLVDPVGVPEPSVILLMGVGLIGIWGFRKKFKK